MISMNILPWYISIIAIVLMIILCLFVPRTVYAEIVVPEVSCDVPSSSVSNSTPSTEPTNEKQEHSAKDEHSTLETDTLNQTLSNTEQKEILNCLLTISHLGTRGDLNEQEQVQLRKSLDYISGVNGFQVATVINNGIKGEELMSALHAVGVYAYLTGQENSTSLGLSPLGVAVLLQSMQTMLGKDRRNDASILFVMYNEMVPRQKGSLAPVSEYLGCGRNRLYHSIDYIKENGLNLENKHSNAEGAGRPTLNQRFADAFEPICNAAGLKEDELIGRHVTAQLRESTSAIDEKQNASVTASDKEEEIDVPDGFKKTDEKEESKFISDNPELTLQECYDAVNAMVPKAIDEINSLLLDLGSGNREGLETLRSILTDVPSRITSVFSDIFEENSISYEETVNPVISENDNNDTIFPNCDVFRYANKCNTARALLKEVEAICLKVSEYTSQRNHDFQSAYVASRKIETEIHPRGIKSRLGRKWAYYESAQSGCDKAEKVLADIREKQEALANTSTEEVKKTSDKNSDVVVSVLDPDFSKFPENADHVSRSLDKLIQRFEEAVCIESTQNERIATALQRLREQKTTFSKTVYPNLGNESPTIQCALSAIVFTLNTNITRWMFIWDKNSTVLSSANQVGRSILSKSFENTINERYKEFSIACTVNPNSEVVSLLQGGDAEGSSSSSEEQNTSSDAVAAQSESSDIHSANEISDKEQHVTEQAIQAVEAKAELLKKLLIEGSENKTIRKNSTDDCIAEACEYLDAIMEVFKKNADEMLEANDNKRLQLFKPVISGISSYLSCLLDKWIKGQDGEYFIYYTTAKSVSKSMLTKRSKKCVDNLWTSYAYNMEVIKKRLNSDASEGFLTIDKLKSLVRQAEENGGNCLPVEKREELIRKFWSEGKDPLDIRVWIEHIVEADCKNSYGDPTGRGKYCRLTRDELNVAFYYLTGFSCCSKAIWKILTHDMGYSGRQCAKLDQFGDRHPLAGKQYDNIKEFMDTADRNECLILSVDTKAQIVLGKFKPDNGRLMCSPGSGAVRAYDHDFPLRLKDIYYNGTDLFDENRLDEKAVLHPVGVYCINDNTGYISLVIGKDNSESMHNLMRLVITKKQKQMPNLKRVLVIADGGGSNMSNGMLWPTELMHLTDEVTLPVQVAHTAPGCSKHNLIERALFSCISKHWKSKFLLDIEHVVQYISETTTHPASGNPLKVECVLDTRRYRTNAEKKAAGEKVLTRAEFDKMAKGRIIHAFPEGDDLYKWNYTILPKCMVKEETSA